VTACDDTDGASDELSDSVMAACSPFTTSLSKTVLVKKFRCIDVFMRGNVNEQWDTTADDRLPPQLDDDI